MTGLTQKSEQNEWNWKDTKQMMLPHLLEIYISFPESINLPDLCQQILDPISIRPKGYKNSPKRKLPYKIQMQVWSRLRSSEECCFQTSQIYKWNQSQEANKERTR